MGKGSKIVGVFLDLRHTLLIRNFYCPQSKTVEIQPYRYSTSSFPQPWMTSPTRLKVVDPYRRLTIQDNPTTLTFDTYEFKREEGGGDVEGGDGGRTRLIHKGPLLLRSCRNRPTPLI